MTKVAAGDDHVLAVTGRGNIFAWGGNEAGQINVPSDLANIQAVAAGWNYGIGIRAGGSAIQAPVRLTNPNVGPSGFSVSLPGRSDTAYVLQYKDSMSGPQWSSFPRITGIDGVVTLTDSATNGLQRYYRVQQVPQTVR